MKKYNKSSYYLRQALIACSLNIILHLMHQKLRQYLTLTIISILFTLVPTASAANNDSTFKNNHVYIGFTGGYMFKSEPFMYTSRFGPELKNYSFFTYPISASVERRIRIDNKIGLAFDRLHFRTINTQSQNTHIGDVESYAFQMVRLLYSKNSLHLASNKINIDLGLILAYRWGFGEQIIFDKYFWEVKNAYHTYNSFGFGSGLNLHYFPTKRFSFSPTAQLYYFHEKTNNLQNTNGQDLEGYYPSRLMFINHIRIGYHF